MSDAFPMLTVRTHQGDDLIVNANDLLKWQTHLQSRCEAAERDVKRWRDTADESAKNVTFLRDKEQQAQRQAEQECNDADGLLEQLGLNVEQCRTDGGWLNVPKIISKLRDDPPWTRPQDTAISALRKERDRLRGALEKYGECKPKCTTWEDAPNFKGVINSGPCSCGYVAALAPQEPTTDTAIKEAGHE